ncbi:MAG: alpha/beta hydrolase [Solirubrobacteraceae bacterium]
MNNRLASKPNMGNRGKDVRRRRLVAVAVFAVVALVSFASGAAVVVASRGADQASIDSATTINVDCPAPSLSGRLPALVSLPAGYSSRSTSYPVVYFLHGLPAGPTDYQNNTFVAAELAAAGRRAIVVQPQGARSDNSDREYLDWDAGENWPQAIAHDLVSCIDARFRTNHSRYGRALIGLSAGGYGAFNIGLRNLDTFAAIESWSGYFAATNPSGTQVLNLGSPQANSNATVPSGANVTRWLRSWPTLLSFYVGVQDSRFLILNKQYDAALTQSGVSHTFRTYPGGHSSALWRAQAPAWLGMALDALPREARAKHR